jgi:hypothetical protein
MHLLIPVTFIMGKNLNPYILYPVVNGLKNDEVVIGSNHFFSEIFLTFEMYGTYFCPNSNINPLVKRVPPV